jgi:starch phosphorylase
VRSASTGELRRFAEDPECRKALAEARGALSHAVRPAKPPASLSRSQPVAYFSMEFGVHEALPVYAGGLGILAGDHAKSASDEAVPFVGVGLFYHCGYFRQELDGAGHQRVLYPKADPADLPLEAARDAQGRELLVPVELEDRTIRARVWRLRVGRVNLLLLDTNVQGNSAADRRINDRLYGGTREDRIRQEVVAGIGGVRALRALGIHPGVWHLNEGHVSFITLERIREARSQGKLSFAEAVELVAADTVFTTHTPVPEGNEVFDLALARRYLSPHAKAAKIAVDDYLSLGLDSGPDGRPFLSMTVLAIRLSRFRNGVSALHGEVSRRMWGKLWPGFRWEDAPITSVTNGVHTSSWVAPSYRELYRRVLGKGWESRLDDRQYWRRRAPALRESDLFRVKQACKRRLVDFVREREMARLRREGRTEAQARSAASQLLDPEIFTIGFARRFALYKRSALPFPRPRAGQEALHLAVTADPDRFRRKAASGRSRGEGRLRTDRGHREPKRAAGARGAARELRHRDGSSPRPGRRLVAQQPAPPARGERHERAESARERRSQPQHSRRLVVRGIRPAHGLGVRQDHRGQGP